MANLETYDARKLPSLLSLAAVALYAMTAVAQGTSDGCGSPQVIPLTGSEPPAKIVIYPPLAGPLASRGVAIIQYCAQNLHLVPGVRRKCPGCLAARRTRSCESRRCIMGVGRCEWQPNHPDGPSPRYAQSVH